MYTPRMTDHSPGVQNHMFFIYYYNYTLLCYPLTHTTLSEHIYTLHSLCFNFKDVRIYHRYKEKYLWVGGGVRVGCFHYNKSIIPRNVTNIKKYSRKR